MDEDKAPYSLGSIGPPIPVIPRSLSRFHVGEHEDLAGLGRSHDPRLALTTPPFLQLNASVELADLQHHGFQVLHEPTVKTW